MYVLSIDNVLRIVYEIVSYNYIRITCPCVFFTPITPHFLAHLGRRLRGELIVYQSSCRPSVRVCVHTFKHEYLRVQWVDRNQILSEASLGWGIDCNRFWARSDQNSGFHGNRKLP